MDRTQTCPQCGAELPRDAMQGLCPRCMARVVFGAGETAPLEPAENQVAPIRVELPPDDGLERPGTMIGRYKLLEKIGEGGFGVVYMAEQIEPVRRRVALKVIKAGMDTREVIARFEAERQALALMDHPNIARILDAGVTGPRSEVRSQRSDVGTATPLTSDLRPLASAPGWPYFVMELVKGIPITTFCDEKKLSPTERLQLFMKVCQAVQHAHQKAIIHRDLKPSNVLVTLHDGEPVPKVIDFGIAKALGPKLTEKTLFTKFAHLLGTPAYMSPEQAELSGLDIDTRSDIYSLGVLLYELLTGVTPFPKETLAKAALDEIRRMIREVEPPKPSTRLSQQLVAVQLTKRSEQMGKRESEKVGANTGSESESHSLTYPPAHSRSVSPQQLQEQRALIQQLRGDLDWIVMKCLEKDRKRRYETANGLAMDLQRHLNHEPVTAAAPSAAYRAQKFIGRNKTALAVAGSLVLLLLTGTVVSTWQAVRATRAEHHAEAEASKSSQVAQFLKDMLEGVGPSVALGRDTTMLREILDKIVERIRKDLKAQPAVEVELRNTIGEVYRALGESEQAERMHREALEKARDLLRHDPLAAAVSLHNLAAVLIDLGKLTEADTLSREALALFKQRLGNEHPQVATALNTVASVLYFQGKLPEAVTLRQEALAMRRKLLGNDHVEVAQSLNDLALVFRDQGRLDDAKQMYDEALATWRKGLPQEHPDLATTLNNLGLVLADQGHLPEAEARLMEALAMWRKLIGKDDHVKVAEVLDNLGMVFRRQARFAEAEARHREALAIKRKLFGDEHASVATSMHNLAQAHGGRGRFAEAEIQERQALAIFQKVFNGEHANVAVALNDVANYLYKQGQLAEAAKTYGEALAMQRKMSGNVNPEVAIVLDNLGFLRGEEGKLTEADDFVREGLAIRRQLFGGTNPAVAKSLHSLAFVLEKQGQPAAAEQAHHEALALRRTILGNEHPEVARSLHALAVLLQRQGRLAETEAPARECLAIFEKKLPDDWQTFSSRSLFGASLAGEQKYAEAEPLLRSGYEGMKQREATIPPDGKPRLKEAGERLVQLYEAWGKPEPAAEWRQKLR